MHNHLSLDARKFVLGFSTRLDTNRAVQPQKMARGLKIWISQGEGLFYICRENKVTNSCAVTAQLICVFVFAYAKTEDG